MIKILLLAMLIMSPLLSHSLEIIHTAPPDEELTKHDITKLKNIFTRKQTKWDSTNENITVFIRPLDSIEHKIFVFEWLAVTNYRFKKLLKQNTFSGKTTSVKIVRDDELMAIVVANTPNSIGYTSDYLVINENSNVITLTLD